MMSPCKESYIGGDYIETTGGSCKVYAKGNIGNTSVSGQFGQNGLQNGVLYGQNKPAPIIEVDSEIMCAAHFRPLKDWKGEYGFDWYREGNPERDNSINYDSLLGKYYEDSKYTILNTNINDWTDYFSNTPDLLKDSNEFKNLIIVWGKTLQEILLQKLITLPGLLYFLEQTK